MSKDVYVAGKTPEGQAVDSRMDTRELFALLTQGRPEEVVKWFVWAINESLDDVSLTIEEDGQIALTGKLITSKDASRRGNED